MWRGYRIRTGCKWPLGCPARRYSGGRRQLPEAGRGEAGDRDETILALILAGGKGVRLEPLTRDRAKPAVPFGGAYRIIDFTLSNCINSGLRQMLVLTQYKAMSLDRHINLGWRFLCRELDEFIDIVPPQQRIDEHWYQGTADAVYQNIYTIEKERARVRRDPGRRPHLQDGLCRADPRPHRRRGRRDDRLHSRAAAEGDQFGIMQVDYAAPRGRISRRSRGTPIRCPATRRDAWLRWGSTSSTPAFCSSSSAATPRSPTASTISAGTSSRR